MTKAAASMNIAGEIFTDSHIVYRRTFFFFGTFAIIVVFFAFLSLFITFLTEPTEAPSEVKITNINDQSVTVTWKTTKLTAGQVIVANSNLPRLLRPIALLSLPTNNRFLDSNKQLSTLHSVTINRLSQNTTYLYRITTGLHTYKIDVDGQLLPSIKTSPVLTSLPTPNPLYGEVKDTQGEPVVNAMVYLYIEDVKTGQPISTFLSTSTNKNGYYLFDLTGLRNTDLKSVPIFLEDNKIKIVAGTNDFKVGELLINSTLEKNLNPVIVK